MLNLEPLLRARLDALGLYKGVWGLGDFSAEKIKPTPCAYVIYDGARVLSQQAGGAEARVAAHWLVVIAAKNVSRAGDGAAAREDAQALAEATLAALLGWRPDRTHQPLHLVELPRPEYQAGTIFLPLVFSSESVLVAPGDD